MKKFKFGSMVVLGLFMVLNARADFPVGRYMGSAFSSGFQEWCQIYNVDVRFGKTMNGKTELAIIENGFAHHSPGSPVCEIDYNATLTATAHENEWKADFNSSLALSQGKAVMKDNVLTLTGDFDRFNTGYQSLRIKLTYKTDKNTMMYNRQIDRGAASTLMANGELDFRGAEE